MNQEDGRIPDNDRSIVSNTDDLVNQFEAKKALDYCAIVAQSEHVANTQTN